MKPQTHDAEARNRAAGHATGLRLGVVASRFNEEIVGRLVDGARAAFTAAGGDAADVEVVWVPGAFELPLVAQAMAARGDRDILVCVGAVIRGDTAHFDYVAGPASYGIAEVSRRTGVPIGFGLLTTDTVEQARERAGGEHGNKGADAVHAAIETLDALRSVAGSQRARAGEAS